MRWIFTYCTIVYFGESIFLGYFFHGKKVYINYYKNGVGYMLGDFFTNSFGYTEIGPGWNEGITATFFLLYPLLRHSFFHMIYLSWKRVRQRSAAHNNFFANYEKDVFLLFLLWSLLTNLFFGPLSIWDENWLFEKLFSARHRLNSRLSDPTSVDKSAALSTDAYKWKVLPVYDVCKL
jgi:hypothetical protein